MMKAACLAAVSLAACSSSLTGPDGSATGTGGAGGATACEAAVSIDRTCATASDCVAVLHTSNCCGQGVFIGIRASQQAQFQTLEAQCDATYPACGCAAGQPTTDDGSLVRFDGTAGVTCVQGRCTTFVPECGAPCPTGTTCFSCTDHGAMYAVCTAACVSSFECTDPALSLCQSGPTGNTFGMYCTAANVACDTQ